MELSEAIRARRSTRRFIPDRPVPREHLREVLDAARWAPTPCNRQLIEFVVVEDAALKQRLHAEAGSQRWITDAPTLIAVLYDKRFNNEVNDHVQTVGAVVENMLLKATELGVGALWMAGIGDVKRIKRILGVPSHLVPASFVLLGYPRESPPPVERERIRIHRNRVEAPRPQYPRSIFPRKWRLEEVALYQQHICRASVLGRDYERFIFTRAQSRELAGWVRSRISGTRRVLDIWSYDGSLLREMVAPPEALGNVVSVEMSMDAARFVKAKAGTGPRYVLGHLGRLPFGNEEFDAVTCWFKLERAPEPETLLREMVRVLKPGGRFYIAFFNRRSAIGLYYYLYALRGRHVGRSWGHQIGPFSPLSPRRLRRLLAAAGLRVTARTSLGALPHRLLRSAPLARLDRRLSGMGFARLVLYEAARAEGSSAE